MHRCVIVQAILQQVFLSGTGKKISKKFGKRSRPVGRFWKTAGALETLATEEGNRFSAGTYAANHIEAITTTGRGTFFYQQFGCLCE